MIEDILRISILLLKNVRDGFFFSFFVLSFILKGLVGRVTATLTVTVCICVFIHIEAVWCRPKELPIVFIQQYLQRIGDPDINLAMLAQLSLYNSFPHANQCI